MAEVPLDYARQWVEFPDPANPVNQFFRCDLTWLTSRWSCIYGSGCKGIMKEAPDAGCCSLGAHFSDKEDRKRVTPYVQMLSPEEWEHADAGSGGKWLEKEDGVWKTRVTDGACIFSNSAEFAGGMGCAFHKLADRLGVHPLKLKPDVCWQLPIRRGYEMTTRDDGTKVLYVTIGEFTRRNWGAGGHSLDWYCTGNPDAHHAADPVYVTSQAELIELMGEQAYEVLVEHCRVRDGLLLEAAQRAHAAAQAAGKGPRAERTIVQLELNAFAPHPADHY